MPSRILRDWTDSMKFDGISAEAERLFTRLLMKADDFGRFHADPRLIRSGCFPLLESVRTEQVDRWLDELSTRRLLFRYEVGGRAFLAVVNFRQRLKQSVPKFPPADGKDRNWLPDDADFPELPGTSRNFPSDSSLVLGLEASLERERGAPPASPPAPPVATKSERFRPPSVDEVRAEVSRRRANVDPEAFVAFYESKGWKVGAAPMRSWQAALTTWVKRGSGAGGNGGPGPQRLSPYQAQIQEEADQIRRERERVARRNAELAVAAKEAEREIAEMVENRRRHGLGVG